MKRITLKTEADARESEIVCGAGAFDTRFAQTAEKLFVFTDENVFSFYEEKIKRRFPVSPVYAMRAGEANKGEGTLFSLLRAMADAGLHRNDCLVCIGGGVVGDVGGLAGALYMRGITVVQIPTTLLAQVDSSVGGKTAIDFQGIKNLVGAFKQPEKVLVDGTFLGTLPKRELKCGLGEMIKHGALSAPLFDELFAHKNNLFDLDFLTEAVPEHIAYKAEIVRRDPQEAGLRKCLNLGHTTGHAYELLHGKLSHGEYVMIGLLFEAEIAKRHLPCDNAFLEELKELVLLALGKVPALPPAREAARYALLDKKNTGSGVSLTVPVAKGEYMLLELPLSAYAQDLEEIGRTLC